MCENCFFLEKFKFGRTGTGGGAKRSGGIGGKGGGGGIIMFEGIPPTACGGGTGVGITNPDC